LALRAYTSPRYVCKVDLLPGTITHNAGREQGQGAVCCLPVPGTVCGLTVLRCYGVTGGGGRDTTEQSILGAGSEPGKEA
jgi:hypothetical protein